MFEPGDTIAGKYVVERVLGEGGMGTVLGARHSLLGERVAIKVLSASGDGARARLLREAQAAARLKSDHVVRVLDVLELPDGRLAIVLEHVDGATLADELRARGALPFEEAVAYVLEATHGVAEAHARGIVHRDLKPSNLLLSPLPDGRRRVRVIDFGIAKLVDEVPDALTRSDALLGSPAYMSPEQIRDARDVDARADVWSLGVVLYELLSGALPFEGFTTSGLLARIVADPPVALDERCPSLPGELVDTVHACLSRDPALRPASMAVLAARLAPHVDGGDALARSVAAVLASPVDARPRPDTAAPAIVAPASMTATAAPDLTHPGASIVARPETGSSRRLAVPLVVVAASAAVAWGVWPRARAVPPPAVVAAAPVPSASVSVDVVANTSAAPAPVASAPAAARSIDGRAAPRGATRAKDGAGGRDQDRAVTTATATASPVAPAATTDPLDALGPRK